MSKILVQLFVLATLTVVTAAESAHFGVSKRISPFGIVEGITDCGSVGILGRVEIQDCTQVPCHFIRGNTYDLALRFTASVSTEKLVFLIMRFDDVSVLLEVPINGAIEAGIEYELKYQIPIPADLTDFTARLYILSPDILLSEVCAQLDVTFE